MLDRLYDNLMDEVTMIMPTWKKIEQWGKEVVRKTFETKALNSARETR